MATNKNAHSLILKLLKHFNKNTYQFLGWTSKTKFNNDQPRSEKEKDLWLETLFRDYSWDIETHCYEKPSKSAQIAFAQEVKYLTYYGTVSNFNKKSKN